MYWKEITLGVSAALLFTLVAPANAFADPLPLCPPSEDPDCYFLWRVNQMTRTGIKSGDEANIIRLGKQVCEDVYNEYNGNILNWYVAGKNTQPGMLDFGALAATIYCPEVL